MNNLSGVASPSKEAENKLVYVEYIRAAATLAVVFLHIVITLPTNYSANELGLINYAIFNVCYMPTKWAVPCFLMISGVLLLNPNKSVDTAKVFQYAKRMFLVLLLFGSAYAFLELVFNERRISIEMIPRAFFYAAQGKSWDHLWYLYTLISLYVLLLPLRYAIQHMGTKEFDILVFILILGNFLIPTVNTLFSCELEDYMILNEYITYFILGYWLNQKTNRMKKFVVVPLLLATAAMIILEVWNILTQGSVFPLNHQSKDVLTLIQTICIFLLLKELFSDTPHVGKFCSAICKYSFGIYLIHPFFINLLYKAIGFTPLSFPIGIGIFVLFFAVFVLSLAATTIVKRIPFIRGIV